MVRLSERVTHTHTRVVPFADRKASEESDYCCAAEWSSRVVFLNEKWDFCYFSNGLAKNIFDSDNASYVDISVPSSWQDAGIIDKKYLEGYAFSASGKKVSAGKKSGNGVGIYRRKVEVYDFTKKYFLTFDRVDGYFEVYLNGNLCGFSYTGKGEFDVTDKLVSGDNELLVLVREYTKASFIEGQRRFSSSGITGDVYFTLRNETYLSDLSFSSTLVDGVYNARLTLYTEGETPDTEICFSLEKDGKVIFDETRTPEKKIEYDYTGVIDFKSITPFCASSDERSHGKFAVVLARTENFVWVLEERRDNDRAQLWNIGEKEINNEQGIGNNSAALRRISSIVSVFMMIFLFFLIIVMNLIIICKDSNISG